MRIVFSILHYQALDITQICIENLMKLKYDNVSIVVVDNASPNGTGEILKNKYSNNENVYTIINTKNEGFAKGNNIGYQFAKERLGADVIIVMNNDVIIKQKNFIEILNEYENKNENTHIIAPDVITVEGIHQNPFRKIPIKTSKIICDLIYNFWMMGLLRIPIFNKLLVEYLENRQSSRVNADTSWKIEQKNIVPHGAIIIFRKNYIDREDYAFLPVTFMFGEEDILYQYIMKKRYTIMYYPRLKVLHMEDVSIREVTKSELKRRQFMVVSKVKSLLKMLKIRIKN